MHPSPLSWVGTGPFGPEITFMSISQTSSRDVLCGISNLLRASKSQVEPADLLVKGRFLWWPQANGSTGGL